MTAREELSVLHVHEQARNVLQKKRTIEKFNSGEAMKIITSGPVNFIATKTEATIKMEGNLVSDDSALSFATGTAAAGALLAGIFFIGLWIHQKKHAPKTYTVKA
ncbi:Hypothetical predicted protein [Pelobates cultripes]|uniref:Uncharacterized protein n=1 Tax=Pelobates cultripes TaxID=61616 RepID=A0AAD1VZR7_PELCU|nr:Hypothetical predicted protein [Pelobates cultripes]